jgi:hypothetical protein
MDSSNDTLANDDDQSQAPKVMEPTEPTIVDNNTGEEPGVLINIIQGTMTVGNVYWSKLKYHLPTQSKAKTLLSSVKATTTKYLTWSTAGTGLIMLQPKASASQVICNLPNTDTGHPDGTGLNPATSGDIHTSIKASEVTPAQTKAQAVTQVPPQTTQNKVNPND